MEIYATIGEIIAALPKGTMVQGTGLKGTDVIHSGTPLLKDAYLESEQCLRSQSTSEIRTPLSSGFAYKSTSEIRTPLSSGFAYKSTSEIWTPLSSGFVYKSTSEN